MDRSGIIANPARGQLEREDVYIPIAYYSMMRSSTKPLYEAFINLTAFFKVYSSIQKMSERGARERERYDKP